MNNKYIILISLFCASASAAAQDVTEVWEQTKGILKESSFGKKNLDPAYALQPGLHWTASVGATGLGLGTNLNSDIELTDYLESDHYFKTAYPDHNLVRARAQLKLVEDMEIKWYQMQKIVRKYL